MSQGFPQRFGIVFGSGCPRQFRGAGLKCGKGTKKNRTALIGFGHTFVPERRQRIIGGDNRYASQFSEKVFASTPVFDLEGELGNAHPFGALEEL